MFFLNSFYRLIKCLIELKWMKEANDFFDTFREKFPKHADVQALKTLEKRMEEVKIEVKEAEAKRMRRLNSMVEPNFSEDEDENRSNSDEQMQPFQQTLENLRSRATDFKLRFCGHCNTTTDIKEANFFGR